MATLLAGGCLGDDGGKAPPADDAPAATDAPADGRTDAQPADATGTPTPRETVTSETRIELVPVGLSDEEREQVTPLSFESLPADERRLLREAADGGFSVSYGQSAYPTDGGRTAGLSSLIRRVVDRLARQTDSYESTHGADAAVPSHVSAVYVRYEGDLYCLDVVDGDQRYYHCPE